MITDPQPDFTSVATDALKFVESTCEASCAGEIGVRLITGYREGPNRDGRELWVFHASRSDAITGELHRIIGGLVYRVQFGIRSIDRAELFDTEADADSFEKAFNAGQTVPEWSDIGLAFRRIGQSSVFIVRALIARAIRYMRQQRQKQLSKHRLQKSNR